jgi:hypothetical protein
VIVAREFRDVFILVLDGSSYLGGTIDPADNPIGLQVVECATMVHLKSANILNYLAELTL